MKNSIKKHGFTLLEIMVVMIIVGVLATVALVNYSGLMERQKAEEGKHILQALLRAQKVYAIDNGGFTNNINNLDVTISNLKYFDPPTVSNSNPIATIVRTNNYTLTINDNAVFSCGGTDYCAVIGIPCSFSCPTPAI